MIYVDIKGNLGNQMFIYAFARKIQEETGMTMNLSYYNLKKYFKINEEAIRIFKLNENTIITNDKIPTIINPNCIIRKIANKIIRSKKVLKKIKKIEYNIFKKFGVLYWDEVDYIDINIDSLKKFKKIYITGYWQSDKYFSDIHKILMEEFVLRDELNKKNRGVFNEITKGNSICISIRRGDYISDENNKKKFYLCDIEYFNRAIEYVNNKIKDCTIFCFSDDIEWVKKNIKFNNKTYYERSDNNLTDKIILMKACDIFVISNSSFSWWIQYLSNAPKLIVAPSRWYRDGSGKDIYQSNWKTIAVGSDIK